MPNPRICCLDVGALVAIGDRLRSLCERVCWRARRRNIIAHTITLKLRYDAIHLGV